jgi:predicted nucleic-acid-binding protein
VIALDTNVLLRYFVQDDPAQARRATLLLEKELTEQKPGLVTVVALIELIWVMEQSYGAAEDAIAEVIPGLLEAPNIVVERGAAVRAAMRSKHGDLADRLLHEIGRSEGCVATVTFDKRFARLDGVELLTAKNG